MPYAANMWPEDYPRAVVWTRGAGCGELADLLATGKAVRCEGDLARACLEQRADLAVMAGTGSFDVVPVASPHDFESERVKAVVAAVAGGPHSRLAAVLAARLSEKLGVPGSVMSGYRTERGLPTAAAAVAEARAASGLPGDALAVSSAAALVVEMPEDALLILGAPGGGWLHRQFLGQGTRLSAAAPSGVVVVRSAPLRAFHRMSQLDGFSLRMRVADARVVAHGHVLPIVDEGTLVGVVRESVLADADPDGELADVMEQAPFASAFDALAELQGFEEFYEGAPVPVVDRRGLLVGGVASDEVAWPNRPGTRGADLPDVE